jgi:hypothetical protein
MRLVRLALVGILVALGLVVTTPGTGWAAGCTSSGICGDNTQQIAGPDGTYGERAFARVYFRKLGNRKDAWARVWCEDRYGTNRPCNHIYFEVAVVVGTSLPPPGEAVASVACGHTAPACTAGGISGYALPSYYCGQAATYGVADPINVELPHGAADNGNRVGSFTVDTTC